LQTELPEDPPAELVPAQQNGVRNTDNTVNTFKNKLYKVAVHCHG